MGLKNYLPLLLLALILAIPQPILASVPTDTPTPPTPPPSYSTGTTNWTDDCVHIDPKTGEQTATIRGITCLIRNVIQPLPVLIVLLALGMILFASAKIILSGSDPKAYATGMQILLFAIIGIILLSAAWLILVLIERLTGAKVTQFGIAPAP
jgi:hypothetical protein